MTSRRQDRRHILKSAGVLGALAAMRVPQPALATAEDDAAGIAGSWIVSIAYTPGPHRTKGLATFIADGSFVASVSAYEVAPATRTPTRGTTLHGIWVRTGGHDYTVTAVRLHLDARGTWLGTMTTRISLSLDASLDAWSGTFVFDAAHPSGTVLRSGQGTLQATRIRLKPV